MSKCPDCNGARYTVCPRCEEKGCEDCVGTGYSECRTCKGTGLVNPTSEEIEAYQNWREEEVA